MTQRVLPLGAEKESLQASPTRHRDVVLWKLDGLDDEQLRRPMVPSGTNLIGLVKHLASVEYGWFCSTFGRPSDAIDLDATGTAWSGETVSMRWVLIHMLEDTVRHAGQMDIIRELLDGATGDHPDA